LDGGLGQFCYDLVSPYYTNDTSVTSAQLQDGIVSFYGLNRSVEIYAHVIYDLNAGGPSSVNNATAFGRSIRTGLGQRPDSSTGMSTDEYAWLYQTCTEAGKCDINPSYAIAY
jgi:hypothetical protein